MATRREYGIDALRIAAMMMIVMHHVIQFGGLIDQNGLTDVQFFETWLIEALCYVAVNCYALISGYVGVTHKPRIASLMTMWLQVAGYSTGLVFVMELLAPDRVNMSAWTEGLLPVINNKYWYFTAYVLLFLMMPFLNELLTKGDRSVLRRGFASTLIAALCLTMVSGRDLFDLSGGFCTLWLAVLYVAGGYLRLYGKEEKCFCWARRHGLWVYLCCSVFMALAYSFIFKYRALLPLSQMRYRGLLYDYLSIPVVLSSFMLFAWFSAWEPGMRKRKWIARLAPATFGVYIIHMQANVWEITLMNRYAWLSEVSPLLMPLCVLGISLAIYMSCTVIDWMRIAVFRLLHIRGLCQMLADGVQKLFIRH